MPNGSIITAMKYRVFSLGFLFCCFWATVAGAQSANYLPLVPQPDTLYSYGSGNLPLTKDMVVVWDAMLSQGKENAGYKQALSLWKEELQNEGIKLVTEGKAGAGSVALRIGKLKGQGAVAAYKASHKWPDMGYTLSIGQGGIELKVASDAALFSATRTLRQLQQFSAAKTLPYVNLADGAQAARWRGMHLDVSRHYMPVASIKKWLSWMAYYKLNVFHWHLTDDQGWRIPITKYPLLTSVGAVRAKTRTNHSRHKVGEYDNQPYSGTYSHADIKDIVAYAQKLHIMVVPEIDLPGHMQAAIAAYPWLGSQPEGEKVEVWPDWGVSPQILNPSDKTLQFLYDVMDELAMLFPAPYIHIGGDEAEKGQWKASAVAQERIKSLGLKNEEELQAWLIRQVANHVRTKYKKHIIGWDEVLDGGLKEAIIMSWRGTKGGIKAGLQNQEVVMSPGFPLYLDAYQAEPKSAEPLAIGGMNKLSNIYGYNPVPDTLIKTAKTQYLLGVQGNVWTEYLRTPEAVEYMVFPRITALAELGWHQSPGKKWDAFQKAVQTHHAPLWEKAGINYSKTGLAAPK